MWGPSTGLAQTTSAGKGRANKKQKIKEIIHTMNSGALSRAPGAAEQLRKDPKAHANGLQETAAPAAQNPHFFNS